MGLESHHLQTILKILQSFCRVFEASNPLAVIVLKILKILQCLQAFFDLRFEEID